MWTADLITSVVEWVWESFLAHLPAFSNYLCFQPSTGPTSLYRLVIEYCIVHVVGLQSVAVGIDVKLHQIYYNVCVWFIALSY